MRRLLVLLLAIGACQDGEHSMNTPDRNTPPYANAGLGGTYRTGTTVSLDASGSYDPDGSIVAYHWRVLAIAPSSRSTLSDANAATMPYLLDAPGDYSFEVTVTDDKDASVRSTVSFHAEAPLVEVSAGADFSVDYHATAQLAGSVTIDADVTLDVQWAFASKPAGSTATLTNATTLTPSFTADREGAYVLTLTASTSFASYTDDVTVTAVVARQLLEYNLIDAEYSKGLDRFIIVSDSPPRLRIRDAKQATETEVTLPASPIAVSVSPDGLRAAVAHASSVTIVNLQTLVVSSPYPVSMTQGIWDVVLGPDNRVHCFDSDLVNSHPVRTINLANGSVAESQNDVYGHASPRLHPSGTFGYLVTYTSPEDLVRFDTSTTPVQLGPDSPYHGDYAMGGPMWITEDGGSIITASGNLFVSSSDPALDMRYSGTLGLGTYNWAAHSTSAGKIAALRTEYNNVSVPNDWLLRVYTDDQLTLVRSESLPDTPYNSVVYRSAGRFIAFSADSTKVFVIARAVNAPGSVHAIYTYQP